MTRVKLSPPTSQSNTSQSRLSLWLSLLALGVYTLTRLIRLPDFPIFFFTDEAIQAQHAVDLVHQGFRNAQGVFMPTYFENGGQLNLSLSVYLQVLPTLIFGKSIWVTRGVSAALTLIAAISLGLILHIIFESHYAWLGPLLLAISPAWFLHSRTAFETVLMASLYAGFLYCYLRYRRGTAPFLYPALVFGGLAFYAYSPGQVILFVTGLMLLVVDARYHWHNRKTALFGLIVLFILAIPYLRFILTSTDQLSKHLALLDSYWMKPLPLSEKVSLYFSRYLKGFNPFYWFSPNPALLQRVLPNLTLPAGAYSNQLDLDRHTMKGYGHLLLVTFPFWALGLVRCVRRRRDPAYRTLLIATLAAPSGAAMVDWGITRGLVFIIPATLMTAMGLETFFDRLTSKWQTPRISRLSAVAFILIAAFSFWMLGDALQNGPTWYRDYGLSGMQFGAPQVFAHAAALARAEPETTVLVSSTWANGADVLLRYFVDDYQNIRMGHINAFAFERRPLDRQLCFVMTAEDLQWVQDSEKFIKIQIDETLPYPDGSAGFHFVRLEYAPEIDEILAAEREARETLLTEKILINGKTVSVQYPTLDINTIAHAFDGDPTTLIRTLDANPLRLILSFSERVPISRIHLLIGGTPTRGSARAFTGENELGMATDQVGSAVVNRELTLNFNQTHQADRLEISILNIHDGEIAHVHLWEVTLE